MILENMKYDLPLRDGWIPDSVIFGGKHNSAAERVVLATDIGGYQVVRVWPDGIEKSFYSGTDKVTATEIYLFQARLMIMAAQGVAVSDPEPTTG